MKIKTFSNMKGAGKAAAEIFAEIVKEKPESSFGLGAGKSMIPFYEEASKLAREETVDMRGIRTFQVHEFLGMPGAHPLSHRFFLVERFFDNIPAAKRYQKRLPGLPVNMAATCEKFESRIKRYGGIDLLVLELGTGDWLGMNEPGTPFTSRTREVVLSDEIRDYYAPDFPRGSVPRRGITMGIRTILDAKKIIVFASGAKVGLSLERLVKGKPDPEIPTTALKKHDDCLIFADNEAAAELPASAING